MTDTVPRVLVEGLSRRFAGGVAALSGVSCAIRAGELVAITGPSGSGKSTLLSLIGLLDRPTSGRVSIAGVDLAMVRRPAAFRASHVGFVFQFHHLIPTMTLLENVAAPLVALGVRHAERSRLAGELLERMQLSARAGALPSRVSGGERQRAAVARAVIARPLVILADEPTGQLDTESGALVVELLVEQAREAGATVLVATHNPEIAATAPRRIMLRDGRLVLDATMPRPGMPARVMA